MRVPVYPEDLLPQAAFKKLAKSIQNSWPGTSPIQLSLARETLSRGLGNQANWQLLLVMQLYWLHRETTSELRMEIAVFEHLGKAHQQFPYHVDKHCRHTLPQGSD